MLGASLQVESFSDTATSSVSSTALDRATKQCAIINSARDCDPKSGRTSFASANLLIKRVCELRATVQWILETDVHADHLLDAQYLKQILSGRLGIGQHPTTVQTVFGTLFNLESDFARDGRHFDHLFTDGESIAIGDIKVRAIHTLGHNPGLYDVRHGGTIAYTAFVGDTLFMPDYGTARCDFPGGDAHALYRSDHQVLSLPLETQLFMCHDYQPSGREIKLISTVAKQRETNVDVQKDGLIWYARGRIEVLYRASIEERCCECYKGVKTGYDRLLPARQALCRGERCIRRTPLFSCPILCKSVLLRVLLN